MIQPFIEFSSISNMFKFFQKLLGGNYILNHRYRYKIHLNERCFEYFTRNLSSEYNSISIDWQYKTVYKKGIKKPYIVFDKKEEIVYCDENILEIIGNENIIDPVENS